MKKIFKIFKLASKTVHVPSTDYYARNNQPQDDELLVIEPVTCFDDQDNLMDFTSEEEALNELNKFTEGEYLILPVYVKN